MKITKIPAAMFASQAAKEIAHRIQQTLLVQERCCIGLSGGLTPGPVYEALCKEKIDWSRITLLLVDDRYVLPHHRSSNQFLLEKTLTDDVRRSSWIIVPDTTLPIDVCIADYSYRISIELSANDGHFDLLLLGMGDDGHIASLFPPLSGVVLESTEFALHTTTDTFDIHDRISLSPHALSFAKEAILLLSAKKESVLFQLQESKEGSERWPLKLLADRTTVFLES